MSPIKVDLENPITVEDLELFAQDQMDYPDGPNTVILDHDGTAIVNPFCDEGMRPFETINDAWQYYGAEKFCNWVIDAIKMIQSLYPEVKK